MDQQQVSPIISDGPANNVPKSIFKHGWDKSKSWLNEKPKWSRFGVKNWMFVLATMVIVGIIIIAVSTSGFDNKSQYPIEFTQYQPSSTTQIPRKIATTVSKGGLNYYTTSR